ncbi:RluA family pseudouridine synthase [Paenibacillus sp. GCM10012303]|uniref:RluA family pseudouridine synthase n=1 Tax=Paenibacillus sp. GCM10012303 TaxID=3317340 RepID=UPI00362043AC
MRESGRRSRQPAPGGGRSGRQKPGSKKANPNDKSNSAAKNSRSDKQLPVGKTNHRHENQQAQARTNRRDVPAALTKPGPSGKPAPKQTVSLKSGRRKGEWMEFKLPDSLASAPLGVILKSFPIPAKVAGRLTATNSIIKQGQLLRIKLFPSESPGFPGDWVDLNILYEDDFTLVVNKPAGVEVHPSTQGQRGTLAHAVAAYYEASGQKCRVRHIHRLDKETTGPVLYAKNELAHYEFDKAMREKTIERIYLAVAEGAFEQRKGKIDKPIAQDRHHSTRRRVSETGDPAVTLYEVVEYFAGHTLVRLRLETGRTHQIRVHLSSIHHPLAGDGMYGGTRRYIHRQALHGERLIWVHPWTGERMEVRAPLPEDMSKLLDDLRNADSE